MSGPPPGKAARNERRKAVASLFNGLAGAVVVVGLVQPLFGAAGLQFDWLRAAAALFLGLTLHAIAYGELRQLED